MAQKLKEWIEFLRFAPDPGAIFNPWFSPDPEHDLGPDGPEIRKRNLELYLQQRIACARYLLCAEAVGYQGGHFSGIAMTSERILLGFLRERGIAPEHVVRGHQFQRTSNPLLRPSGFSEPTATVVWQALVQSGCDPNHFVLWNIFPWHPFHPEKGMLSNRTPTTKELRAGPAVIEKLLALLPPVKILAIGEKSAATLGEMGLIYEKLRHPAQGGVGIFRAQFSQIIRKDNNGCNR